jgi:hypothetical protein
MEIMAERFIIRAKGVDDGVTVMPRYRDKIWWFGSG